MRFLIILVLTALLSYFALLILPWWITMPIAFLLILWLPMSKWKSFLATGLGTAICFILITLIKDINNNQILSTKIASLFQLPSSVLLILLFGLIGFITSGLGGWAGAYFISFFREAKSKHFKK